MNKIMYNFRTISSTDALKDHAEVALADLFEALPQSAHFRWIIDFDKKHHIGQAELTLQGHRDVPLVVKEENKDLYQAMTNAAKKMRHLLLVRRETRRAHRHDEPKVANE